MLRRLVVTGMALTSLVALAAPPAGAADPAFYRQSGVDRYGTAAAVSSKAFPAGADNVFIASGTSFPDAMAGASFAAANGGPILLVRRDALPNATAEELDRLHPKVVTVLGGTSAVSDPIAEAVAEHASVEARRVSGADRWSTAANISSGFVAPVDTVYVASGLNYPDALTGGAAIGGTTGGPVLLVLPNEIPAATAAELTRLKPTNIVVLGGTAAVSKAVLDALVPYAPNAPIRRSGNDRYETALQVANAFSAAPIVYLARGDEFADAMAAGAAAGFRKGPILLVPHDCIPFEVDLAIQRLGATEVIVLGGTSALSDAVLAGTPCPGGPP